MATTLERMEYASAIEQKERKVFGRYETVDVPVDLLVRMPQVRKGNNSELDKLKDSIRSRLLNAIDVARMEEPELEKYIAFVNRTWRADVSIENYYHQRQWDDNGNPYYYLVIAGHSRTEAISQLQDENPDYEYAVAAKIHDVTEYDDIIAIQLDENIYSPPQPARRATAIVEAYRHGIETGKWEDEKQFLERSGDKFSADVLKDALGFAKLPLEAQDFVFTGSISYSAAVALGRASDTLREYTAKKLEGYQPVGGEVITFDTLYRSEIAAIIAHMQNEKMGAARAEAYIKAQVAHKEEIMKQMDGPENQPVLFLVSPEEQVRAYREQLKRELREARARMKHLSVDSVREVQRMLRQLAGDQMMDDDLERERTERILALGYSAASHLVELAS